MRTVAGLEPATCSIEYQKFVGETRALVTSPLTSPNPYWSKRYGQTDQTSPSVPFPPRAAFIVK